MKEGRWEREAGREAKARDEGGREEIKSRESHGWVETDAVKSVKWSNLGLEGRPRGREGEAKAGGRPSQEGGRVNEGEREGEGRRLEEGG